ncbi:3-oxoacid CoA-transferase subunit A [Anaerotignum sp.]|uniref:3-oxoacid CoA-transferase subunit A n=1 Tax=Anaerotignum sp. TaxID=2039241 RepID=UPI0027152408|nr:3-oxoacid CoA-transferase subunit A [Anaerotignum sp.]
MKVTQVSSLDQYLKDDMTIMVGGFLGVGTPEKLISRIVKKGYKNITLICNDTAFIGKGAGKLIEHHLVKKAIVSHIGTNPETGRQMISNEIEVNLVPQGTLAEKVRAGGVGLGGILTATGIGTEVQKGKTVVEVEGKEYILEAPLRADLALIFASVADEKGNLIYYGSTRNFNPIMAMAADTVFVEAKEIVPVGALNPSEIVTPHILVDYIVKGE